MKSSKLFYALALLLCLGLAGGLSFYASSSPDGLEKVAEDKGFALNEQEEQASAWQRSPMPDYATPGVSNERLSGGLAGVSGTLVVLALGAGLALLLRKKAEPELA